MTGVAGLVIIGCSRRKARGDVFMPALDLYEGNGVPLLRGRISDSPAHRERVLILSARYGLVGPDEPIKPYDQRMSSQRSRTLRTSCARVLSDHLARYPADEALLLMEPAYLAAVPDDLYLRVPVIHVIARPITDWTRAERVLDSWSWPCAEP